MTRRRLDHLVQPIIYTLDLPVPPSVNRSRKVHWRGQARRAQWKSAADALVLAHARGRRATIEGPFEATVTLSESATRMDLDNAVKSLIDYAREIELIRDDGPKHMRRLVVQWGDAPEGCRLVLRELADQ
jgi:Holliday junction resolvase RusA-like endonuclease